MHVGSQQGSQTAVEAKLAVLGITNLINKGGRTAALHVQSNDGTESPFDITLTGTAIGPEISVQQPVNVQLGNNIRENFSELDLYLKEQSK